jgi:glucoamylase
MQGVAGIEAFGKPGIEPRWTHSNKDGVGTAYSASSHLWFTIWNGIVTEVYYPTIDRPQLRDLQYLITDGSTFFHEEKRDLKVSVERISDHTLGYRCTNADPDGRYAITKEVIGDPHLPCLLQRTRIAMSILSVRRCVLRRSETDTTNIFLLDKLPFETPVLSVSAPVWVRD